MPSPTRLLALLATLLVAAPLHAATFSDGTMSGWTSFLASGAGCSAASTTPQSSGGNPGNFLQFTNTACDHMVNAALSPFSWNPASQGAIASMTVGFDATWLAGGFLGDTRIGVQPLIRQGGTLFYANYHEVTAPAGWSNSTVTLLSSDWCTLSSCATHPDFSTAGAPIEFGIAASNNCPACAKTLNGGLDNYALTITQDTQVPEPASLTLLALGLAGLGAARRRKSA